MHSRLVCLPLFVLLVVRSTVGFGSSAKAVDRVDDESGSGGDGAASRPPGCTAQAACRTVPPAAADPSLGCTAGQCQARKQALGLSCEPLPRNGGPRGPLSRENVYVSWALPPGPVCDIDSFVRLRPKKNGPPAPWDALVRPQGTASG